MNGIIFQAKKETRRSLIRLGVEQIGKCCLIRSKLVSLTIPLSVTKILTSSFSICEKLKFIFFTKDSQLNKIGKQAFFDCISLEKIKFPKSLKVIKADAFYLCKSLRNVFFPKNSQLERIEKAFINTFIKRLSLPPSIREIDDLFHNMYELESVYLRNDLFKSNNEGTVILSLDGSELIGIIPGISYFVIPEGVLVIRKKAFVSLVINRIFIPASVEVIENSI